MMSRPASPPSSKRKAVPRAPWAREEREAVRSLPAGGGGWNCCGLLLEVTRRREVSTSLQLSLSITPAHLLPHLRIIVTPGSHLGVTWEYLARTATAAWRLSSHLTCSERHKEDSCHQTGLNFILIEYKILRQLDIANNCKSGPNHSELGFPGAMRK